MERRLVMTAALVYAVLLSPAFAQAPKLKDVKIRGYVTEFRSPTSFDIEDYRITREDAFTLDFENASPDIAFGLDDIRVGVELEIRGQLNEATGELKAKSIRVDLEQFKSIGLSPRTRPICRTTTRAGFPFNSMSCLMTNRTRSRPRTASWWCIPD